MLNTHPLCLLELLLPTTFDNQSKFFRKQSPFPHTPRQVLRFRIKGAASESARIHMCMQYVLLYTALTFA